MTVDIGTVLHAAELRSGLVTRGDLYELGLSGPQIGRLVARRVLHPIHRDVMSAHGPVLTDDQRRLGVCLAVPGAVVSGASAADHWGLRRAPRSRLEITVTPGRKVRAFGALVRHSNRLPDHHVLDLIDGLRVTSVARTLFDAGAWLDRAGHRSMVHDARDKGLVTIEQLAVVHDELAGRGRRGSSALEEVLATVTRSAPPVMSEYELRLAEALVAAGLPAPALQHPVDLGMGVTVHVDLALLDVLLALEVDHSRWHTDLTAFHRDRSRDNRLALLGWERLRFTEDDIDRRLRATVALVAAVYERRHLQLGSAH